jgi:chromosome partitioning protein
MEKVKYTRARLASLLGLSAHELAREEESGVFAEHGSKDVYTARELSLYRSLSNRRGRRGPLRRQLFLNFKGGTGKTSLSVTYGYRLAELGHRVLLVDLDSQGHATKCFGYDGETFPHTLYDVLVKKVPLKEARVETALSELHLVPANLRMATIDLALMPMANREHRFRRALAEVEDEYEYIIMDAPPSFGLMNLLAIVAAQDLFVPVLPDFLSFHGLKLLFETLDDIEDDLDHTLERIMIVINQYNPTTKIARAAREALQKHYGDYLMTGVVRQCTKFAQASSEGVPVFAYDPESKAAADIQKMIEQTRLSDPATTTGKGPNE